MSVEPFDDAELADMRDLWGRLPGHFAYNAGRWFATLDAALAGSEPAAGLREAAQDALTLVGLIDGEDDDDQRNITEVADALRAALVATPTASPTATGPRCGKTRHDFDGTHAFGPLVLPDPAASPPATGERE